MSPRIFSLVALSLVACSSSSGVTADPYGGGTTAPADPIDAALPETPPPPPTKPASGDWLFVRGLDGNANSLAGRKTGGILWVGEGLGQRDDVGLWSSWLSGELVGTDGNGTVTDPYDGAPGSQVFLRAVAAADGSHRVAGRPEISD